MVEVHLPHAAGGAGACASHGSERQPGGYLVRAGVAADVASAVASIRRRTRVSGSTPSGRRRVGNQAAVMGMTAFIPDGRGAHAEQVVVDAGWWSMFRRVRRRPRPPPSDGTAHCTSGRLTEPALPAGQKTLAVTGAAGGCRRVRSNWRRARESVSS